MKLYSSIAERLETQHLAIENIISAVEKNRLVIRPKPGKWNIHDNVAHLTRYQVVFIVRINKIVYEEAPFFDRYSADEDPEFENYKRSNIATLINQLSVDRKIIYHLITTLNDDLTNRVGVHKKYGALNITQWTEFFLLHEFHHIFTIFQLAHDAEIL
jgi:hypothetical protein